MIDTKISWAHATWNPWEGCNVISRECVECYAKARAVRCGQDFNVLSLTQTFDTPHELNAMAERQSKSAICFVCSLSDFFHEQADHWRRRAWEKIRECPSVLLHKFFSCCSPSDRSGSCSACPPTGTAERIIRMCGWVRLVESKTATTA